MFIIICIRPIENSAANQILSANQRLATILGVTVYEESVVAERETEEKYFIVGQANLFYHRNPDSLDDLLQEAQSAAYGGHRKPKLHKFDITNRNFTVK